MYVDIGSMLNLSCVVSFTERPPIKVSWLHNGIEISFRGPRNGVSVSHILIEFLSRHTFLVTDFCFWGKKHWSESIFYCVLPPFSTQRLQIWFSIPTTAVECNLVNQRRAGSTTWVPFRLGNPKAVFRRDCFCYQACHYRKFASVRKVLPDSWWWWCDRRDRIESWRLEN